MPLDTKIKKLVDHWHLVGLEDAISTPSGHVIFCRRGEQRVVLKMPNPEADEGHSHKVLEHYAGDGAVRLLDRFAGSLLLERAFPGRSLTDLVLNEQDDEATGVICDTLGRLTKTGDVAKFLTVEDWGAGFERHRQSVDRTLPEGLVDRAAETFRSLTETQSARVLLHGDLHHDNIVFDEQRGWLAIDPKGVVGEREYETGAFLRNPTDDERLFAREDIVERRVDLVCKRLGFAADRVLNWAFAQAVLSAIWSLEDGRDPRRGVMTARIVGSMLGK